MAQKAVYLLRGHYVYVRMAQATGFIGSWKIPEYVLDCGIINTHTGARVLGFGKATFKELKAAELLSKPAKFPSHYKAMKYPDLIYTLEYSRLNLFVIRTIIEAVVTMKEEF